jgi:hypothetical protein
MAASSTLSADVPKIGAWTPVMSLISPIVSVFPDPEADPAVVPPDDELAGADDPAGAEVADVVPLDEDLDDELHAAAPTTRSVAATAPHSVLVLNGRIELTRFILVPPFIVGLMVAGDHERDRPADPGQTLPRIISSCDSPHLNAGRRSAGIKSIR